MPHDEYDHLRESSDEAAKANTVRVETLNPDGTWTIDSFEMPQDLVDSLAAARAEWKKLREAGTPYWCIHEGRSVSHPAAYWKEDGYFRQDGIQMQYKHGVMCRDCGGYIQEG